jgi:hypothetical protein
LRQAGEPFSDGVPKSSVIFGKVILRAHGNFGQQNGVLQTFIVINNYYDIISGREVKKD